MYADLRKSANIIYLPLSYRNMARYVEDFHFKLKHLLLFEICTREICKKFVYKHSETMEYLAVKNQPTFKEVYKLHIQTNNSRTSNFLNAKFLGYSVYIKPNLQLGGFSNLHQSVSIVQLPLNIAGHDHPSHEGKDDF